MLVQIKTRKEDREKIELLREVKSRLIWRVHVRRGLETYNGKDYSITGVFGVQFWPNEIESARS